MRLTKLFFAISSTLLIFSSCVVQTSESANSGIPQDYLLTYVPNGANGDFFEEEIYSGEEFTVKENFYENPEDKKFAYWNTRRDGRGTTYTEGETVKMPYHDLYLFAHWIDCDSYSIIYKNCEGADNTENPSDYVKTEDVNLVAPEKTGYIFDGWYLSEDFSGETVTGWLAGENNKSIAIYAKWTPEKRSVVYKAGIGEGIDDILSVDYDSSITLLDFLYTAPKNKKFVSWEIDGEEYKPGDSFGPVQESIEIIAQYDYFVSGDVSKNNIQIDGKIFENTEEVCVVSPKSSYLIEGSNDIWSSYIWENDHNDFKGAFVEGRNISLSPYAVSKYEVTRELFTAVFGKLPASDSKNTFGSENSDYVSVGGINWYTAIAFCNKLTLLTGGCVDDLAYFIDGVDWQNLQLDDIPKNNNVTWNSVVCDITKPGYRLLTEAEWEFAARGGNSTAEEFNYAYAGFTTTKPLTLGCSLEEGEEQDLSGNGYQYKILSKSVLENWSLIYSEDGSEYAWLNNNSSDKVHQTGLLKPNSLGIYDMAGNLWEWVWDYYAESPSAEDYRYKNEDGIVVDPMGPATGSYRMRKGSNYQAEWGFAVKASSAYRGERMEEYKTGLHYGMRIGRSIVE